MTPTPEYSGPERRKRRHHGEDPVTNDDLVEALAEHTAQERKFATELYSAIMGAFPDGTEKHRQAHERMIKAAEAEESFWRDLKADIARKSIWGILHILTVLVIAGLGAKLLGFPIIAALVGSGK